MNARMARAALRMSLLPPDEKAVVRDCVADRMVAELTKMFDADPRIARRFGTVAGFLEYSADVIAAESDRARLLPGLQ